MNQCKQHICLSVLNWIVGFGFTALSDQFNISICQYAYAYANGLIYATKYLYSIDPSDVILNAQSKSSINKWRVLFVTQCSFVIMLCQQFTWNASAIPASGEELTLIFHLQNITPFMYYYFTWFTSVTTHISGKSRAGSKCDTDDTSAPFAIFLISVLLEYILKNGWSFACSRKPRKFMYQKMHQRHVDYVQ